MVSVNNLHVYFGGFELLRDISFMINPGDRIGLTGKNGAGKTTLLKIIAGIDKPNEGSVNLPKGIDIGYLPQHMKISDTTTVYKEAEKAFEHINNLKKNIDSYTKKIENRTDYESQEYLQLINKLTFASERFELLGGNSTQADIEQTLLGLGFRNSDFNRSTKEFSGGWRMRIELAKILLSRPGILLLDEPTNHLDIESIQWMEEFLVSFDGPVMLVSHDRAFLDKVTNRTIEISLGKIYDYKAAYSEYIELRKERQEQQLAAWHNQQKYIQDTERFIERFRYKATKAVQVQSRIKQLEKLDKIEIDEEDKKSIRLKFPQAPRSGTIVTETQNLRKTYGDNLVLDGVDMIIERGEKVAFVGRNGEGKTTLAKIIMNQTDFEGVCKIGHNVKTGYFAQDEPEKLDNTKTVFETIDDVATGEIRTKIRDILGGFLFSGEDIDKKVSVLSGGERSRLALAKLLLEQYNLLLLDEPTNHLDIRSKDILKNALQDFEGTIILVSHDRDFLDGLINKVYEFRDRKTFLHLGGIYDFLRRKKISSMKEIEKAKPGADKKQDTEKKSFGKNLYLEKKEIDKKLKKAKNSISGCEKAIELLENDISVLEQKLSVPENNTNGHELYKEYEMKKSELERKMEDWENHTLTYESLSEERQQLTGERNG
jgi:ATP-binding cassette, subfamily F, member 3